MKVEVIRWMYDPRCADNQFLFHETVDYVARTARRRSGSPMIDAGNYGESAHSFAALMKSSFTYLSLLRREHTDELAGVCGAYPILDNKYLVASRLIADADVLYWPPRLLAALKDAQSLPLVMTVDVRNKRLYDHILRLRQTMSEVILGLVVPPMQDYAIRFYGKCIFYARPIKFNHVDQYVFSTAPVNLDELDGYTRAVMPVLP